MVFDREELFVLAVQAATIVRDMKDGRSIAVQVVIEAAENAMHVPADDPDGLDLSDYAHEYVQWSYDLTGAWDWPTWVPRK